MLDENGMKTGRRIVRGQGLRLGDFHLVVHVWIRNDEHEFLIQRRADHLNWMPGIWATTGGSVIAGEDSLTGAIRETKEELGIDVNPDRLDKIARLRRIDSIVDLWLAEIRMDEWVVPCLGAEVSEVKWASKSEIREMVSYGQFYEYSYLEMLFRSWA